MLDAGGAALNSAAVHLQALRVIINT